MSKFKQLWLIPIESIQYITMTLTLGPNKVSVVIHRQDDSDSTSILHVYKILRYLARYTIMRNIH